MAQPYINPTPDPNYLGYTKDIPAAPADASYGKLFENVGALIGGAAKGVDTLIEDAAKKDARKIIQERIQAPYTDLPPEQAAAIGLTGSKASAKELANATGTPTAEPDNNPGGEGSGEGQGGDDPGESKATPGSNLFDFLSGKTSPAVEGGTPLSAQRTEPVPTQVQGEIDQNISQLQRLQQGRGVGIISPTYLYTQYTAAAKALYSKYPGYEDVIDQEFHKLTGVVPANAQIHAIWQNFQNMEATQNTTANKWQTELHGMVKDIPGPDAATFMAAGQAAVNDPLKQAQLRVQWANYRGSTNATTQDKAKLELDLASRKLTVATAEDTLSNVLNRSVGQTMAGVKLMAGADGQGGWSMADLQGKLDAVARNPALLKEQDAMIRPALNQLYTKAAQAVDEQLASPQFAQVPVGTKTAQREAALLPIKTIIESYASDGKQGVATASLMSHYLEQLNTGDAAQLSAAVPALRVVGAVSKIGGSYIASDVFTKLALGEGGKDISLLSPENREAVRGVVFNGMLGKGNFWSDLVPKTQTGEIDKKAVTPEVISKKIEAFNTLISHPEITPEMKQNLAKYLVGPASLDLIKEFDGKSQDKIYSWLNNPTTRDVIYKEGQTNPQLWTNYKAWATDTLLSSTMDRSASLASAIKNSALNVRWDEASGQLLFDTPGPRLDQFGRAMHTAYAPDDVKTLQNFNLSLKSLQGIYDKDGEKISKTVLPTFVRNSALPPIHGLEGEAPQKVILPSTKTNLVPEGKNEQMASPSPTQQLEKYVKDKQDGGNFDVAENRFKPNQAHVSEKWGNPFTSEFKEKNLTPIQAGGQTVLVNKVAATAFQGFLKDLEATGYQIKSLGGYDLRAKKGNADSISQHAFGNAIDINPNQNPFNSSKTDMPPQVAELARKWGLSWGGQWKSVRDPMHFEYAAR